MITGDASDGFFFSPEGSPLIFGPFETKESAERCAQNFEAFVETSPECHHS